MSDFLAIAAVKGKVLHLVDWDRPVWFLADNPLGDRIIPDPNSFLTDASSFFHIKILICLLICLKVKEVRTECIKCQIQLTLTNYIIRAI